MSAYSSSQAYHSVTSLVRNNRTGELYRRLPADLSIFNSRNENKKVSFFLSQKADLPYTEVLIVNTDILKAICIIFEKVNKGFAAHIDIYSPNETVLISAMMYCYKDKVALKSDILNILGGTKMPNQPLQSTNVKKDITSIVNKYNKTEQIAQPDRE